MERPLHQRAFRVSVAWTLFLLFLGSVVHATGSSLACPDWPTCYGSWMPEMSGGIFWEHLHRLVAGGLILMWILATYLAWKPGRQRPWLRCASVAGIVLLLVQAVFGGVTVILRLPPAVSTSHLGLAFVFLALAVVMAVVTHPRWGRRGDLEKSARRRVRAWAVPVAVLVFAQSLLGAWVRHAGAGLACPGVPLCLGEWIPPLDQGPVVLQYAHRVLGLFVGLAVVGMAGVILRSSRARRLRLAALASLALVAAQVILGFVSVATFLEVTPVSLHTLVAALLLGLVTALATWTWEPEPATRTGGDRRGAREGAPITAAPERLSA